MLKATGVAPTGQRLPFTRLIHADWSIAASKSWAAEAVKEQGTWIVEAPHPVGPVQDFVEHLLCPPHPTLAGFDFPLGIPAAFGEQTGFGDFLEALDTFGTGKWSDFYAVNAGPESISLFRPFYPNAGNTSPKQVHLLQALGVAEMDALRRQCEMGARGLPAACALFWTLGANQVGKAAISGWRQVIVPARKAGARLWPFEGDLSDLCRESSVVLCETYPADAARQIGLSFPRGFSKRRREDRKIAMAGLTARCAANGIKLQDSMIYAIDDGFGAAVDGEDQFDATAGLLGIIEVVEGRRPASPSDRLHPQWEGWILGR